MQNERDSVLFCEFPNRKGINGSNSTFASMPINGGRKLSFFLSTQLQAPYFFKKIPYKEHYMFENSSKTARLVEARKMKLRCKIRNQKSTSTSTH